MALKHKSTDYSFSPYRLKPVHPTGNIRYGYQVPKPRSGHRCVATDNDLYSFGGFNPRLPRERRGNRADENENSPIFRELWKFNFATKCWSLLKLTGAVPKKLASHSTVLRGNTLLSFGGTGVPFGDSSSNKLSACDMKTLRFEKVVVSGEEPIEQYGQAVALDGNYLYVVGGTTGFEYNMNVHCINLNTNCWQILRPTNAPPPERYRHEIAFVDDSIYVFGGGTASTCFSFMKIHAFNVKTCEWSCITTHPDPSIRNIVRPQAGYPEKRRCHSLVQEGRDIFIYGGFNGLTIFSDFWRLNTDTHTWRRIIAKVILPTYFHSAALTPSGCMFIYGGVSNIERNLRTSDIFSIWLKIPKLKDICWEAVRHYHQDWIYASSKNSMLQEGIPKEYVDSIEMQAECG